MVALAARRPTPVSSRYRLMARIFLPPAAAGDLRADADEPGDSAGHAVAFGGDGDGHGAGHDDERRDDEPDLAVTAGEPPPSGRHDAGDPCMQ